MLKYVYFPQMYDTFNTCGTTMHICINNTFSDIDLSSHNIISVNCRDSTKQQHIYRLCSIKDTLCGHYLIQIFHTLLNIYMVDHNRILDCKKDTTRWCLR